MKSILRPSSSSSVLCVNSAKLHTARSWFAELAKIGNFPWVKVMLICAQYTCHGKYYGAKMNNSYCLQYISATQLKALAAMPTMLSATEEFCQAAMAKYSKSELPHVDESMLAKARVSLMVRAASRALLKMPKSREDGPLALRPCMAAADIKCRLAMRCPATVQVVARRHA